MTIRPGVVDRTIGAVEWVALCVIFGRSGPETRYPNTSCEVLCMLCAPNTTV